MRTLQDVLRPYGKLEFETKDTSVGVNLDISEFQEEKELVELIFMFLLELFHFKNFK